MEGEKTKLARRIRCLEEDKPIFGLTPGEEAELTQAKKRLAALEEADEVGGEELEAAGDILDALQAGTHYPAEGEKIGMLTVRYLTDRTEAPSDDQGKDP